MRKVKECLIEFNKKYTKKILDKEELDNDEEFSFTFLDMQKFAEIYHTKQLKLCEVSRSNKEEEDPIIGGITEIGFTTPSNHGILKIEITYGHYKIEKCKKGDKVELVITHN